VVTLFQTQLGYDYYGNREERDNNRNVESEKLSRWLKACGVKDALITGTAHTAKVE